MTKSAPESLTVFRTARRVLCQRSRPLRSVRFGCILVTDLPTSCRGREGVFGEVPDARMAARGGTMGEFARQDYDRLARRLHGRGLDADVLNQRPGRLAGQPRAREPGSAEMVTTA